MTRCLVLGAGLIGSHVARALADRGHAVTVVSRGWNPWFERERRERIDCRSAVIDPQDAALAVLVGESDYVVHLASSSRPPGAASHPLDDLNGTVGPVLGVLELVRGLRRPPHVLLASSGGTVYGDPVELPTPESHPLQPTTPYGISNVTLEHYARFYRLRGGLPVTTLRFANVYGPGQLGAGGQGVVGTWFLRLARGEPPVVLSDLSIRRDFVYVDDVANAVVAFVESACPPGPYNVGSGAASSLAEVLELVERISGVALPPADETSATGHATADIRTTQLDTRRLREAAGWTPVVGLEDGLERTWDWVRNAYLPAAQDTARASDSSVR